MNAGTGTEFRCVDYGSGSIRERSLTMGFAMRLRRRSGPALRRAKQTAKFAVEHWIRIGLPRIVPRVLRTLPHDERAMTQGLAYHGGYLYESTGGYVHSSLRRLDPADGSIRDFIPVPGDFAEGIAVVGERLYQLSWESGRARVYRIKDLAKTHEIRYEGEAWGLTSGRGGLIMSDGSSLLHFRDEHFRPTGVLRVRSRGVWVWNINDIECVEDRLYVNILGSTDLLEVGLTHGEVTRVVDCSALVLQASATPSSVLNGIASDPERGTLYLTGKEWNTLFEIAVNETAN